MPSQQPRTRFRSPRPLLLAAALLGLAPALSPAQDRPPEEVRQVIEGTWRLAEWHVGDRVLRPPEMEGRWMVHDGWVMAIRHRQSRDGYESTAGYGPYRWGATTWTYGYERSEDRRGPTAEEAPGLSLDPARWCRGAHPSLTERVCVASHCRP